MLCHPANTRIFFAPERSCSFWIIPRFFENMRDFLPDTIQNGLLLDDVGILASVEAGNLQSPNVVKSD